MKGFIVFVASLSLFAWIAFMAIEEDQIWQNKCIASGGIPIQYENGTRCVKKEFFIQVKQ
jgi:hypothetical protein